ncbi:MAG: hypothetical protein OEV78_01435 [Spirochaetia bacterium]|nr:hypothetical protein [Spirochaetia bacterium]
MKKVFATVFLIVIFINNAYSVPINAAFTKNIIDENKYFIEYIDPHVTNFYSEEYFKIYKEAVTLDFTANTYFLSGEYTKCYKTIIESQKLLRKLYYDILTNHYEVDTDQILKMSGPIILLSKDKKAEFLLKSGYEEKSKGSYQKKLGFGVNKFLLSQKIKFYIDAIDHIIRAKRYAILALVESTVPIIDKSEYKTQTFEDALRVKNNVKLKKEISDYDYIRNELINNINKKNLPANFPLLLHHSDNYGMIYENKKSVLNEIGDSINSTVKGFKNEQINNNENTKTNDNVDSKSNENQVAPQEKSGN